MSLIARREIVAANVRIEEDQGTMWQELPPFTREWSEDDWELYFDEQDRQYQVSDEEHDPNGHPGECPLDAAGADSESPPLPADGAPSDDPLHEDWLERELNEIPAWRAAVEFGNYAYDYVAPICHGQEGGPREYVLRTLCHESYLVQDYIAAGHEIGYDEETLCGNIALCRRAVSALARCAQCLERVAGKDREACSALSSRASVTQAFLTRRIERLRDMVWWR